MRDERRETSDDRYRSSITRCAGFALAASLLQCGLLIARQTTATAAETTKASSYSTWKSQTTGNEYRVRIEADTFRAEWTNVPADVAGHGGYIRTECKRVGSKWIGTTRSLLPCTAGSGPNAKIVNWCPLVTRTEIDSIAPDRITGRAQAVHRSDCESCKLLETVWKDFVWAPKR
jgi:hypothetical protein